MQAFAVDLPVEQMLSLRRAVPGVGTSEAACLSHVLRLHGALRPWQNAAAKRLPERPALCADETGMRIDGRNRRLHVVTDGSPALKFLHERHGRKGVDAVGGIPRYVGAPVRGCRASCLACDGCAHALCGARLPGEPAFAIDSSGFRRTQLM